MATQRMTKTDFPLSFGVFKPVGHVVVAVEAAALPHLLRELDVMRFDAEDITCLSSAEMEQRLHQLMPRVSGMAGFGFEVQSMRRYEHLAHEGYQWVVVYAPDAEAQERVAEAARRHGAKLANKYNRFTVEELI